MKLLIPEFFQVNHYNQLAFRIRIIPSPHVLRSDIQILVPFRDREFQDLVHLIVIIVFISADLEVFALAVR